MPFKVLHKRKRLIITTLAILLLPVSAVLYFAIVAIDHPPQIIDTSALDLKVDSIGHNTFRLGKNWIRQSKSGIWEAYIEGEPFERGVAFGKLTRNLLYFQESAFVEQLHELVPSQGYLRLLKYFVAFFNRNLDKHIAPEYQREIYGTSFACSPEFDFIGSGYQRQLNYHAAHDIGHALQGLSLVACTSLAVWDTCSNDSSLLIGRNFDFYMGEKFAVNKIVCFMKPSNGYRFVMITWPDLIGVVSGMNEKGLTVTLNAAKSKIPGQSATPVTLLAREILQYASSIEEAYAISLKRKLFVSESIMIGSAADHKTAIIEKSPEKTGLFSPDQSRVICSNHFQGAAFVSDKINLENIRESDSYARFQRVKELTDGKKLSISDMAAVLRDRQVLGNRDAGMGNQLAINQLIAHHSVIFRPDSLQFWVSTSPWQLGAYVSYDLNKIFNLTPGEVSANHEICTEHSAIPADTFMSSASFSEYRRFLAMSKTLRQYGKQKKLLPAGFLLEYARTNPRLYLTYVNLGDYCFRMKAFRLAHSYYTRGLSCILPGKAEEARVNSLCRQSFKKMHHVNSSH